MSSKVVDYQQPDASAMVLKEVIGDVSSVNCAENIERFLIGTSIKQKFLVQLANQNQIGDHYSSKHPKEKPPLQSE